MIQDNCLLPIESQNMVEYSKLSLLQKSKLNLSLNGNSVGISTFLNSKQHISILTDLHQESNSKFLILHPQVLETISYVLGRNRKGETWVLEEMLTQLKGSGLQTMVQ